MNLSETNTSDTCTATNSLIKIKTYTHNDKKLLVKRITDIKVKKCYIKIFKIIHGDNYQYIKNDNGVFFNLTNLSDEVLSKIEYIVQHYEKKKSTAEQQMKTMHTIDSVYTEDSIGSDLISTNQNIR